MAALTAAFTAGPVIRGAFPFPFVPDAGGRISASGGDDAIRARIIQVLFTAPGERLHKPEFGCGLFRLVFDPTDAVLAAATEFTVGQALARWLADDIVVDAVQVEAADAGMAVQVAYTRKVDLARQAVRIQFR
jgi:phage baseplate assembly protein W